jgi:integrase/recombinase XerC
MRITTWPEAMGAYQVAQRAAGRAPGTIRLHRYWLARLAEVAPRPWSVTTGDLREVLSVEGWAPETRKSARGVFRAFYRWGHGIGAIEDDPAQALEGVRVPAGMPRPAPELVVRQALRDAPERERLMIQLGAYAGLRCAEIAAVHADDLVGDELVVVGKGGRVRAVPILSADLYDRLVDLEGWAFPNRLGSHMSPGHVSRLLSAALPGDWTGHSLRHRMASVAYAGTRDLLAVGAVLGHSRPETTQRYVRMPDDAVRAAVRAAVA